MEDIRDKLKKLLMDNLCIHFDNHDALSTLDMSKATVKMIEGQVDVVIEEILKLFPS